MPYNISKKGPRFFLENAATKRVLGSHKTKSGAVKQMRAVHAKEYEPRKMIGKAGIHMTGSYPAPKVKKKAA